MVSELWANPVPGKPVPPQLSPSMTACITSAFIKEINGPERKYSCIGARHPGNKAVWTLNQFSAFNLSALLMRLRLNASTLGQIMGQIQINAVLQMQQPKKGCVNQLHPRNTQ